MTKTKIERISGIEAEIKQLENRRKKLLQQQKEQERKDRTRRLIEHGAILESLLDGAENLTNEEIKTVLSAALKTGAAFDAILLIKRRQNAVPTKEPETAQDAGA